MAFSSIFKRASNFLGLSSSNLKPPPLDGEIIYCKNNVCVHPPASLTSDKEEHHQGYLTIRSTSDKVNGPSLILTWIPNSTLRKNTKSIQNSPNRSQGTTPKTSPHRRTPRQEFAKPDGEVTTPSTSMASNSPMECCMGFGPEMGGGRRKKHSIESGSSDVSTLSNEITPESEDQYASLTNDREYKHNGSLCDGDSVRNNQKNVGVHNKDTKIGQHVNDLYAKNLSKINRDIKNLTKQVMSEDGVSNYFKSVSKHESPSVKDQHSAKVTNKLKTKVRTDSGRSVSIEMEGDNLIVVTEDLDDEVMVDDNDDCVNLNEQNHSQTETDLEHNNSSNDQALVNDQVLVNPNNDRDLNVGVRKDKHSREKFGSSISSSTESRTSSNTSAPSHPQTLDLSAINTTLPVQIEHKTPDISVTKLRTESGSSTTTSGPDSEPPSPCSSSPTSVTAWEPDMQLDSPSSVDSMAHNLQFPENSLNKFKYEKEKKTAKEQVCGVFSVDLGQMRSLRVFYSNLENTTGQIVIASRESQYKILHFHHGGLDKLAEIFQDWSLFATSQEKQTTTTEDKNYKQFMIVKPQLTDDQCHPEEGIYSMVTEDIWQTHTMDEGIIEDDFQLRKAIFFGGIDPGLRHEAWPFLLHYFPFDSTFEEREHIRNDRYIDYQNIRKKRESLTETEREEFWRNVQCTVEKDVVRTDRSHPYFKGENNPNIEVLKCILLNYAVANPNFGYTQGMSDLLAPVLAEIQHEVDAYWCFVGLMQKTIFVSSPKDCDMDKQLIAVASPNFGYTQGMSDLLAPVLAEIQHEVDAYWCFVGLMQKTIFVSSPKDCDMDKQLNYLRELLRLMTPSFYDHINILGDDAMELLFAHRWILLCFKREFNEKEALRIWESCWSHYQTDYFHLFICVAIVGIYGEDVVEQRLPADEILLHFSSLACHMSGDLVLRKARGLLHDYRRRPVIPCTLHGLCSLCGQGMWDSGHVPTVECTGNHLNAECPYLSPSQSPS